MAAEMAGHLVGAPVPLQQTAYQGPGGGREVTVAAGLRPAPAGVPLGELGAVGPIAGGADAVDLAPDGAAVTPQGMRDLRAGAAGLPQGAERVPFLYGDLSIHGSLYSLGGEWKGTGSAGHRTISHRCCT